MWLSVCGSLLICMVAALHHQHKDEKLDLSRRLNVLSISTILLIFHQSCTISRDYWSYCSLRKVVKSFFFFTSKGFPCSVTWHTHTKKIHVLISAHKHALLLRNKFISPTVIQIFKEKLLFFYIFSDSAELCTPFRWHLRSEVTNLGIKLKKTRCLFKDQSLSYRNLPTVWA